MNLQIAKQNNGSTVGTNLLLDALETSYNLDYNDFMVMLGTSDSNIEALQGRELSLSWGHSNLQSFLSMKSNFAKWFLLDLNSEERNKVADYIYGKDNLLNG